MHYSQMAHGRPAIEKVLTLDLDLTCNTHANTIHGIECDRSVALRKYVRRVMPTNCRVPDQRFMIGHRIRNETTMLNRCFAPGHVRGMRT